MGCSLVEGFGFLFVEKQCFCFFYRGFGEFWGKDRVGIYIDIMIYMWGPGCSRW